MHAVFGLFSLRPCTMASRQVAMRRDRSTTIFGEMVRSYC